MPTIANVTPVSKTGKISMPLTDKTALPGQVPAFYPNWLGYASLSTDPDPCCQYVDYAAPSELSSVTAPWASTLGPAVTGTITYGVTANSDNGDGTWDCVVSVSGTTITSGPSDAGVTQVLINSTFGGNYNPGDHMPVPYLEGIIGGIQVNGTSASMGDFFGHVTGGPGAIAPGFLYWTGPYFFVNDVVYRDRARWDPTPNGNLCYCSQPATLTGEVDYVFFKYIIEIAGLIQGDTYTIYLHFDGDDYGTGTWITDEYEIAIEFVASGSDHKITTLGLPCGIAYTTPPPPCCCCCCCCVPNHDWPNSLGFTRFNRVDFTA